MKIKKVLIVVVAILLGIAFGWMIPTTQAMISEANIPSETEVIGFTLEETTDIETMRNYIIACDTHMQKAHSMANEARALGYDDSHIIIQIAKQEYASASTLKDKYVALVAEYDRQEAIKKQQEEEARKQSRNINYHPFTVTNLSIDEFNQILAGTALAGYGESYYRVEKNYKVNGVFAISVAFHESGYGKYKANTNNFYGMRNNSGWMAFESPDANIQYFGKLMQNSWYYGKDLVGIGRVYCPDTYSSWANAVQRMMNECYKKV